MYYFLSVLTGMLIAGMVAINGGLTDVYGIYPATVIVHVVGLVCATATALLKKEKLFRRGRLPVHLLLGGIIGVATTVFNNLAFGKISVSAIVALSLLGQTITSIVIDTFGLFHTPKRRLPWKKWVGVLLVLAGVFSMLREFHPQMAVPALVSLLAGLAVVISRTLNAELAERTSMAYSTWMNYVTGLALSVILAWAVAGNAATALPGFLPSQAYIYTGGLVGMLVVLLSNVTVKKLPSFYITLLVFIGQVFSGIVLDAILSGQFSQDNLIGGLFVAAGLAACLFADRPAKGSQDAAPSGERATGE